MADPPETAAEPETPRIRREQWFAVGKPLSGKRAAILLAASFLIPVLIYCAVVYTPGIWPRTAVQLTITGNPGSESEGNQEYTAVRLSGETLSADQFTVFRDAIREDNRRERERRKAGEESTVTERKTKRTNLKILRNLHPLAVNNGWLKKDQGRDDAAIFEVWRKVAQGEVTADKDSLTDENLAIVKDNWQTLSNHSLTFEANNICADPLLKLVPQGRQTAALPAFLPAPHVLVKKAWQDFTGNSEMGNVSVWAAYWQSLQVVFFGFLAAAGIGVPVALLCGTFRFFSRLVEPFADFFRYMPAPAFGTVLVAVFNIYSAPKIALVFIGTFPHLVLMVAKTTRLLDNSLLEAAQTLGANKKQLITRVVIPGILPNLYNDLRILLGWAWTWLVIAELIGVKSGLTEIIDTQGRHFHFDHVYPIILLIGVTGFATDQILSWIRVYLFPWTGEASAHRVRAVFKFLFSPFVRLIKRVTDRDPPSESESQSTT